MTQQEEGLFEVPDFTLEAGVVEPAEPAPQDDLPEEEIVEEVEEVVELDDTSEMVSPVFNYYKDNNYFDVLGEDIDPPKNEEEFFELLNKRDAAQEEVILKDIHEGYLSKIPDYVAPILDAVLRLPDDAKLNKDQFSKLLEVATPTELTPESFSDDKIAEDYLRGQYSHLPEETIEDIISGLKDADKLSDSAKIFFEKENNSKKGILDKFLGDANKLASQEEAKQQQFEENFSKTFQSLDWREDRKRFIGKEYTSGNFEKRLEHWKRNPQMLHLLIDFVGRYDGKEVDLKGYEKSLESIATKKVNSKIASYFKKSTPSSGKVTDTNIENLEFDLKNFNL